MGIDANCVPNEALDLQRTSTAPYDNAGATELANLIAEAELAAKTTCEAPDSANFAGRGGWRLFVSLVSYADSYTV